MEQETDGFAGVSGPLSFGGGNVVLGSPNSAFQPMRQSVHQNPQQQLQNQIMQGTFDNNLFYDSTVCCIAFYMLERRTRDEVKDILSQTFRSDELSSAAKDLHCLRNLPTLNRESLQSIDQQLVNVQKT